MLNTEFVSGVVNDESVGRRPLDSSGPSPEPVPTPSYINLGQTQRTAALRYTGRHQLVAPLRCSSLRYSNYLELRQQLRSAARRDMDTRCELGRARLGRLDFPGSATSRIAPSPLTAPAASGRVHPCRQSASPAGLCHRIFIRLRAPARGRRESHLAISGSLLRKPQSARLQPICRLRFRVAKTRRRAATRSVCVPVMTSQLAR